MAKAENKEKEVLTQEPETSEDIKKKETAETAEETKEFDLIEENEDDGAESADAEKKSEKPATSESDDALNSFLLRSSDEDEPKKNKKKLPKTNRNMIFLLTAVIIVAVLVGVVIYLSSLPYPQGDDEDIPVEAQIATEVDKEGVHQVEVPVDEKGEVEQNGYGTLMEYVPADITRIDVENTSGSFSVTAQLDENGASVYTLIGYEEFPQQTGIADNVANDASSLSFISVASTDGNLSDFGLSKPRATVNVTYTDETRCTIRVGGEAAASAGTYVAFGDSDTVYLVENDAVDSFLYGVLEFIDHEITASAENMEDSAPLSIVIGGSRYSDPIKMEKNTDEAIGSDYLITEPYQMFANDAESLDITGSILSLYGESVVCVNPSSGQLADYGLSSPYATVKAVYEKGNVVSLSTSAPDENGKLYIYNLSKKTVYTIALAAVRWANTSFDLLRPDVVLKINKDAVTNITASTGGKSYSFKVHTETKTVDNTDGGSEEVTTTEAYYGDQPLDSDSFILFMGNIADLTINGSVDNSGTNVILSLKIRYGTGRAADTITLYDIGDKSCPAALNGVLVGTVSKAEVNDLIQNVEGLSKGKSLFDE